MPVTFRRCCALVFAIFAATAVAQNSRPLEVSPGITLPATGIGTVVAIDDGTGAPVSTTIHATEIRSNGHAVSNFARGIVYAGSKNGLELPGDHAAISLKSNTPIFYVRLSSEDPETQRNRISLLMMRVQRDSREVMQLSANKFGGSRKRRLEEIPIRKEDVAEGTWVKISPTEKLEAGEYGIVFLPKDTMLFPEVVYDFGIASKQ